MTVDELKSSIPDANSPAYAALKQANRIAADAHQAYVDHELSRPAFEYEMHCARKLLKDAITDPLNAGQPALHLRYTGLLLQARRTGEAEKIDAVRQTLDGMRQAINDRADCVTFDRPKSLAGIFELARYSARHERPDLALGLLDILDRLDPCNDAHLDARIALRERCTPVTVAAYIPPPRPGMISPSAVPPKLGR